MRQLIAAFMLSGMTIFGGVAFAAAIPGGAAAPGQPHLCRPLQVRNKVGGGYICKPQCPPGCQCYGPPHRSLAASVCGGVNPARLAGDRAWR